MQMALSDLITTLQKNRTAATKVMMDWPEYQIQKLHAAFGEMLLTAGKGGEFAEEMAGSLRASLTNIRIAVDTIYRETGAAEHIIEKGRRAIRAARAEADGQSFRIN